MAYRTLKSIFHQKDRHAADAEERARRASPAAVHWDFPVGDHSMFCVVTPDIARLIERIMNHENRARGVWQELPSAVQHHYLRSMIVEEIHATNDIEAVHSTRQEIAEVLDAVQGNAGSEQRRFREMARLYDALWGNTVEPPEGLDDIRRLYDEVTDGEIAADDELDGERFRAGTVQIFSGQKIVHSGAPTEEIIVAGLEEMMRQSRDDDIPLLVRAVIAHFIFEDVHPFYDGNGRTGRYLLALDLGRSLSPVAWLSLSATIADNKERYYKAFQDAEQPLNRGDATVFVTVMLDILAEAQGRMRADLERRKEQIAMMGARSSELQDAALTPDGRKGTVSVLFIIGQASLFGVRGEVTLDTIARSLDKSKQYVRPRAAGLVKHKLVEQVSANPLRFRLTGAGREILGLTELD